MKKQMKKARKKGFWKQQYSLSWQYIKKCRSYILFIVLLLLLSALVGLYYQPPSVVEWIRSFIEDLLARTDGLNWWQMIIFILNNNLRSSFFSMIFGLVLGIAPVITALANGYVLGFVMQRAVSVEGLGVMWKLIPHGIFELPAVVISLALGVRLGLFWFSKNKKEEFFKRILESLRVFLFIVLPLLIIASIIEGFLIVLIS